MLDLRETDAGQLFAMAAVTLALGIVYWLMRERDDRRDLATKSQANDQ